MNALLRTPEWTKRGLNLANISHLQMDDWKTFSFPFGAKSLFYLFSSIYEKVRNCWFLGGYISLNAHQLTCQHVFFTGRFMCTTCAVWDRASDVRRWILVAGLVRASKFLTPRMVITLWFVIAMKHEPIEVVCPIGKCTQAFIMIG